MFHLSDKKPDGIRISPIQHVAYIRNEGNYEEEKEWESKNKFVGNFITSAEVKNACKDFNSLLCKTDNLGSIRNTAEGIEVTEKIFTERIISQPFTPTFKPRKGV